MKNNFKAILKSLEVITESNCIADVITAIGDMSDDLNEHQVDKLLEHQRDIVKYEHYITVSKFDVQIKLWKRKHVEEKTKRNMLIKELFKDSGQELPVELVELPTLVGAVKQEAPIPLG